jgi:RNA polymerase sigma factor (sigma-70 family)
MNRAQSVGLSDDELLARARAGEDAAIAQLYANYWPLARNLASTLTRQADPEDIAGEAFARVFAAMRRGGGPTSNFRAYLLSTVRTQVIDFAAKGAREVASDVAADASVSDDSRPLDSQEMTDELRRVLERLPQQWRLALWKLEVEGLKPRELARTFRMSSNAVSALAYRAREGLREAFLAEQLTPSPEPGCQPTLDVLPRIVRRTVTDKQSAQARAHLDACGACTVQRFTLEQFNVRFERSDPRRALMLLGPAGALGGSAPTPQGWLRWRPHKGSAKPRAGVAALPIAVASLVAGLLVWAAVAVHTNPEHSPASSATRAGSAAQAAATEGSAKPASTPQAATSQSASATPSPAATDAAGAESPRVNGRPASAAPAVTGMASPGTTGAPRPSSASAAQRDMPPLSIRIPRLGASAVIGSAAVTDGVLSAPRDPGVVGLWAGSAPLSSDSGEVTITGHVAWDGMGPFAFARLTFLRDGDLVHTSDRQGRQTVWRVTSVVARPKIAGIDRNAFAGKTGERKLVLITCGGTYDSATRSYADDVYVTAVPVRRSR